MKQQVLTKKDRKVGETSASGIPMVGPSPKGPKRCLYCGQPFKPGECWHRHTSPPDPDYGTYSVGIHDRCANRSRPIE